METNFTNTTHLFSVEYYYFTENSVNTVDQNGTSPPFLSYKNVSWSGSAIGDEEWENYNYWNGSQYPSGYSQIRIILTAFFVTFIMVVIVVGNMLVCIAIATEKALKTVQNWFIASLAVSDFLVGLVIMPFSLAKELMGYWIFGTVWCDIHSALDVLLCTASINNLCLISLDRYWSVTQAVEYLKKRTASRAVFMICFVWILSALISLPPLLGWKKEERPEDYPSCSLSDDVGYVLYSALGSFYIPAIVMVFVYIKIFMAARSRARRHVKKTRQASEVTNDPPKDKSTTTTTCTSFSNPSPPDKRRDTDIFRFPDVPKVNGSKRESPSAPTISNMPHIIIEASQEMTESPPPFFSSEGPSISPAVADGIPEDDGEDDDDQAREAEDEEEDEFEEHVTHSIVPRRLTISSDLNVYSNDGIVSPPTKMPMVAVVLAESTSPRFFHQQVRRTSIKTSRASGFGSSASLSEGKGSDPESTEMYKASLKKKIRIKGRLPLRPHSHLAARALPSDAERQKRRLAKARERRATLILGLIMIAFILAWLPFFVLYVLEALCSSCHIEPTGFATAFWLGYCNSALNPIIYTIFNRDFRRAFKKILLK
ncbi:alpha-2 adrenergic receptor-like [Argiope bruennichi]|uniref:alpha-2 adrenergic receptor-like n=1 Tax=Argiope bruennichi TaxID=94029 RepID=UPI0024954390|nr:alpha-2 adrenergic receptor-like [Argiope bruennichi]